MSGSSNWPPSLKAYVNETFSKCTDANRAAVEGELKSLIFKAFENNELWSIDWSKVKLDSLLPQKKRKSFIPSTPHSFGVTNAALVDENSRREKRARRFVAQNGDGSSGMGSIRPLGGMTQVAGAGGPRFFYGAAAIPTTISTPEPEALYNPNVIDWDRETIVGTSQKLEKPFLRLTSVSLTSLQKDTDVRKTSENRFSKIPDPTTIRPLPILEKTLDLLKKKWRDENNYGFICDQFKSMRQDLTVQRIKNDFTVAVYEIHARIALEKGDLGEFNQCQGQLKELYKHGLRGHSMEFLGYRILYMLFSRNRAELNATLANLTETEVKDPSVSHALGVRLAASQGNYTKLFRLFCKAPKMGAYLMDHFVPRERVQALVTMTKAYQQLPVSFVISQLAFENATEVDEFLTAFSANLYKPQPAVSAALNPAGLSADLILDCKAAHPRLLEAMAKFNKVDLKGQI